MLAVVPVRAGANPELRYALRSWAAHVPEIDDVLLVGGPTLPWCTAPALRTPQNGGKNSATTRALWYACASRAVPSEFVLMNDDFFALRATTIPTWHLGLMTDVVAAYRAAGINSPYVQGMDATMHALRGKGVTSPLCYEVHAPMVVQRAGLLDVIEEFGRLMSGLVLHKRSAYANLAGLGGHLTGDVKLRLPEEFDRSPRLGGIAWAGHLPEVDWVSTSDRLWYGGAGPVIAAHLPEPSPWERGVHQPRPTAVRALRPV